MPRLSGQNGEGGLSHILHELCVHDHAERHGIDQRDVSVYEFGEGGFRALVGIVSKQVTVGSFVDSVYCYPLARKTDSPPANFALAPAPMALR